MEITINLFLGRRKECRTDTRGLEGRSLSVASAHVFKQVLSPARQLSFSMHTHKTYHADCRYLVDTRSEAVRKYITLTFRKVRMSSF